MSTILWSVSKRVDDPMNTLHDFTILNSQLHKCRYSLSPLYLLGAACFQISRCIYSFCSEYGVGDLYIVFQTPFQ